MNNIEDLDEETPESVAMAAVTKSSSMDRDWRAKVSPWLRFMWDAFRNVLDVLRYGNFFTLKLMSDSLPLQNLLVNINLCDFGYETNFSLFYIFFLEREAY